MGVCVKSLGIGLSLWDLGSQKLSAKCHPIHLAEQPLIPELWSVTNQSFSGWISLQASQNSLVTSFLRQCAITANHGEGGVMRCRNL